MIDYVSISMLNDFIFCPYSIYLHNVYMESDEGLYHAAPQTRGNIAHHTVEEKGASHRKEDLWSLPIYSERFRLMGKVDLYKSKEHTLIERKYQLKHIYQGQIYQLWAQYFCLIEMGYPVERMFFYETSTNRMIPVTLPTVQEEIQFTSFIERFHHYNPGLETTVNINKCKHCIYCNLCDKTTEENVY